eukprot:TRINITY_DN758_c1_g1_i1.p1 TRINITY_DN758_c1_g1~~TRINITY_DN758_c1_g1_i1.p1  ORF type:complete len:220 (+),score=56.34 TRINITY_DN758_c1_g1_i1:76-735(+)
MFAPGAIARNVGAGARRLAAGSAARQTAKSFVGASAKQPLQFQPLVRPFSVLGATSWQRFAATMPKPEPSQAAVAMQPPAQVAQMAQVEASKTATDALESTRSNSMVFEIGLSFVVLHYQSIFIGVMRCVFQAFRPLLILFVFGQILKAVFFIAGAPIWMSFYSIWIFEVGYGLAQCAISFIFISFFYNNLSFARVRPALGNFMRQQREKLSNMVKALM